MCAGAATVIPFSTVQQSKTSGMSDHCKNDDFNNRDDDPLRAEPHGRLGHAEVGVGGGPGCYKCPHHGLQIDHPHLHRRAEASSSHKQG